MPPLLHQNVVQTTRMMILAAQAMACTYGILQFNCDQDCMVIWCARGSSLDLDSAGLDMARGKTQGVAVLSKTYD